MVTRQRRTVFNPKDMQGIAVLGTEQKFTLDRTFPVEEIIVIVSGTVNGVNMVLPQPDGLLSILKKANLSVNDGVAPRAIVDYSGVGLLEYAANAGLNLDSATLEAVKYQVTGIAVPANNSFRIAYRIPLVHPMIQEPLRTRMLLPCQNWDQDMNLTLTFATQAEVGTGGALSALAVEVVMIRRQMPEALNQQILSSGGYIPFDLIEQSQAIGVGVSGEQRLNIPSPGSYANLMLRVYKGAATITRDVIDQVTTLGNETKWTLQSGGVTEREFRFKHEQICNEWSRPVGQINLTTSPNFGGVIAANTLFRPAGSVMLDFLGDGLNDANELGSLLDLNIPQKSGLKMELVGSVAAAVTNAHTVYFGGHRFYGDLSRWQSARGL